MKTTTSHHIINMLVSGQVAARHVFLFARKNTELATRTMKTITPHHDHQVA